LIVTKVSFKNFDKCDRIFEGIDKLISDKVECEILGLKIIGECSSSYCTLTSCDMIRKYRDINDLFLLLRSIYFVN